MSVDVSSVVAELGWTQSKTNGDFSKTRQGPDKLSKTLTPNTTTYNRIYAASGTLAGGASVTIDLQSITDYLGQAVVLNKILAIMVAATTTNMKYEAGATNGLTWFLGGTSPTITIRAGGFFLFGDGATFTVSSTVKTITVTNLDATNAGIYEIALIGGQ